MLEFIGRWFRREDASRNLARERLRLVLMSDRVSLAPDTFDAMKQEMLGVVRRYLDVDERAIDMHFENADKSFMLLANIPVLKVRPIEHTPEPALAASGNGVPIGIGRTGGRRRRRRRPRAAESPSPPSPDQ